MQKQHRIIKKRKYTQFVKQTFNLNTQTPTTKRCIYLDWKSYWFKHTAELGWIVTSGNNWGTGSRLNVRQFRTRLMHNIFWTKIHFIYAFYWSATYSWLKILLLHWLVWIKSALLWLFNLKWRHHFMCIIFSTHFRKRRIPSLYTKTKKRDALMALSAVESILLKAR